MGHQRVAQDGTIYTVSLSHRRTPSQYTIAIRLLTDLSMLDLSTSN